MQDRELYQRIVNDVAPWTIGKIRFESATQRVEVLVECTDNVPKQCPHCDSILPVRKHGEEQTWRQPDDGRRQIYLKGRLPLIQCLEHGLVYVAPPWANWYMQGSDNSVIGPYSFQQIKLLVDVGRIEPTTLLKRSGSKQWVMTSDVSSLTPKQDESLKPSPSADQVPAVDQAVPKKSAAAVSAQKAASDSMEVKGNVPVDSAVGHANSRRSEASHKKPRDQHRTSQPAVAQSEDSASDEGDTEWRLVDDSDRDAVRASPPIVPPSPKLSASIPSLPSEPAKPATTHEDSSPADWTQALEQGVKMERRAKVVRKKPVDDEIVETVKSKPRRDAIVRQHEFQHGYQLLSIAYLFNGGVVSCLIPAVCMIFFSRLLLLSTSVFAPFEGGNILQGEQLVACGLSAFSVLVLIGIPVWQLVANGGTLLHFVPSALLGMTIGFGIHPDYLDEVCAVLQWCEALFGLGMVGLTIYTLSCVPARKRLSLPIIGAVLFTAVSVVALCCARPGAMLFVAADIVPPQFRGLLPHAVLYIFGLYGTLVFIPAALLFELHEHTDRSSRDFVIRTGIILGVYVLAGLATVGVFVRGAGAGFFDVPLALVPLACISGLAAGIPSSLMLVDPQYSLTPD